MKFHYEKIGRGKDLVLLHGFGMHGGVWKTILPYLAKQFRVTIIDLPGFGKSNFPERFVLDDLIFALSELFLNKAIWLGWSLGGLIASKLAVDFPEKVEKLVTVSFTPKFIESKNKDGVSSLEFSQFESAIKCNPAKALSSFISLQVFGDSQSKLIFRLLQEELFRYGCPKPDALLSWLKLLKTVDLSSELSHLSCPSLHCYGDADQLVSRFIARRMRRMSKSRVFIFEGASHLPFLSSHVGFVELIKSFVYG